jgi:hypothetical protein
MCPGSDLGSLLYRRTSLLEVLEVRGSRGSSGPVLRVIRKETMQSAPEILFEISLKRWAALLNISVNT